MRKNLVVSLTAIALASPLGIGGVMLTAPVTATHAEALDILYWTRTKQEETEEVLDTCSHEAYRACHESIREQVAFRNPEWREFFDVGDLPTGSNGADDAAYAHFSELAVDPAYGGNVANNIPYQILEAVFPDGTGLGPEDKQGLDDEGAFTNHCVANRQGTVIPAAGGRSIACVVTELFGIQKTFYLDQLGTNPVGFQTTPLEPLDSLAEIEEIEEHQRVTSDNRSEIVNLQGEVNAQGRTLDLLSERVGVAMRGLAVLGEAADKNRKGIALSYALSNVPSTIGSNSRGAVSGGLGYFESESAVAFGVTFRFSPNLTGNVGGGFSSGDGDSVSGVRAGVVWEFGSSGH